MNIPGDLLYSDTHEWVRVLDGGRAQIGLTDHAQSALGDIVFVNLAAVGTAVAVGGALGDVESVKAVSEIFCPVAGVVEQANEQVADTPELINQSPYECWLVVLSDVAEKGALLTAEQYAELLAKEA